MAKNCELSIYRLYCYYSRDHLAIILNVTDGCLFIAYAFPMHSITYASRTYIVSYLTLYILCIYPVILKNATHRAASFFELRKYLSVFLY